MISSNWVFVSYSLSGIVPVCVWSLQRFILCFFQGVERLIQGKDLGGLGNSDLPMVTNVIVDLPHYLYSCVGKPGVRTVGQFFDVSSGF